MSIIKRLMGYPRIPCPICKKPYFKWGGESVAYRDGAGHGVCSNPDCIRLAAIHNENFYRAIGYDHAPRPLREIQVLDELERKIEHKERAA